MTLQESWTILIAIAGGFLTLFNVYKIFIDRKKEQKRERDNEINSKLNEIKEQNREQKEQLLHITKVVIAMNEELRTLGKVNGKTQAAVDELNEMMYQK